MVTAKDVAEYFLALVDEEAGDSISNLKLQKLIYYAQGFHLAIFDEPLFGDSIHAWDHGPVVPDLYHQYKQFGSGPIPMPAGLDYSKFNDDVRDLLDEVYRVYGQYAAWKLRNMTHEEVPWRNARENDRVEISQDDMKEYFKTLVING